MIDSKIRQKALSNNDVKICKEMISNSQSCVNDVLTKIAKEKKDLNLCSKLE
jgi:hypothetical protein